METNEIQKIIITPFIRDRFFIKIDEKLILKIGHEKQKIGELLCQKAETEYGGRHWTAWFTDYINLQEGPYVFNGLPGLIVKISDASLDYDFSLLQVKNSKDGNFYIPKLGKEISWNYFQKMMQNYYNDVFYELKSSGMKFVVGDDKGNVSTISPTVLQKKYRIRFKKEGSNLLEKDKMIPLK